MFQTTIKVPMPFEFEFLTTTGGRGGSRHMKCVGNKLNITYFMCIYFTQGLTTNEFVNHDFKINISKWEKIWITSQAKEISIRIFIRISNKKHHANLSSRYYIDLVFFFVKLNFSTFTINFTFDLLIIWFVEAIHF